MSTDKIEVSAIIEETVGEKWTTPVDKDDVVEQDSPGPAPVSITVEAAEPHKIFFQSQSLGIRLFDDVPLDNSDVIEITTRVETNSDDDDDHEDEVIVEVTYNRKTLLLHNINRILRGNLEFPCKIEHFATQYEGDAPQSSPLSVVLPSGLYLEILATLGSDYANSTSSICLIELLKKHNILLNDNTSSDLRHLLNHVNQHCSFLIKNHFDEFIRRGVIEYNALEHYFQVGDRVVWQNDLHQPISGKIVKIRDYYGWSYGSKNIIAEYYYYNGSTWIRATKRLNISQFAGTVDLNELPLIKINPELETTILQNVDLYVDLCRGSHYRNANGRGMVKSGWYDKMIDISGRIMIDHENFNRTQEYCMPSSDGELGDDINLSRDFRLSVDYTLYGFSMRHYRWCKMRVQDISPVTFRSHAFDQLVLDPGKKNLIRSLVEFQEGSFTDIIENKSGGTIFLLHGEPGTGKTLTAEAISELLQRPLYSIGVSQLGTNCSTLEENLKEILALCEQWNAIALLDEADIFLEQRNHDITRNAMVGVFLRTLEYYNGILFLTTNRVGSFDSAFHSRISLALKYPSLDQQSRKQIWHNLTDAAGITQLSDEDLEQLSKTALNGRQIKNAIRSCQTYCRSQGISINIEPMKFIVELNQQFLNNV